MTHGAAFYDLDKTIIAKSSTLAFRRPFALAGLIGPTDSLAGAAAQAYYRVAGASGGQLDESKARLSDMIRGWPVAQVEALVAGTVEQIIAPYVYIDALKTIRWHKENGRLVVVISASPREWVEPIGYMVGADRVIATQLKVEGGEYTGDVLFYAYGEQKAVAMRALAEAEGIDLSDSWAYSDSFTDVAMLESVGHPVAVNPDSELRSEADQRGWDTVQFMRPPSWDSPLAFLWDAVSALPDVSHATRIALTGWFELLEGAVIASRDATVALSGLITGAEDDLPFFPSVQRRSVRGLRPVSADDVRAAFSGPASGDPMELVRRAAEAPSQALSEAVHTAEESVSTTTAEVGEKVAKAAEAAAEAVRKGTAKEAVAGEE